MEVPDIFETDLRTELERRLSGRIYLPGYLSPPTGAGHGRPPGTHGQAGRPHEHDPPSAAGDGDRPGAAQADGNCHPASA